MKHNLKKSATDISGLHTMRTLHSTGRRSVPRGNQGSAYLDLYMLAKETDRLEKERSIIEKRNRVIEQRLKDIKLETEKLKALETNRLAEGGRALRKSIPYLKGPASKEMKKVVLHY